MEEWRFNAISVSVHNAKIKEFSFTHFGNIITKDDYLLYEKIEIIYIKYAFKVFEITKNELVEIVCERKLENRNSLAKDFSEELVYTYSNLKDRQVVKSNSMFFNDTVKIFLRELANGYIRSLDDSTYLRFGYDFYMYINSANIDREQLYALNIDDRFLKI